MMQLAKQDNLEQQSILTESALENRVLSKESNAVNQSEFWRIMNCEDIQSVYQPIVSLKDGAVLGFEALSRGPEGSPFYSPLVLFPFAEQENALYKLEKMAREKAIESVNLAHQKQLLFINISSKILMDPDFVPGQTMEILQRNGMSPRNVVFEITERSSIEDFSAAKNMLMHYRKQGYRIAIDDAGAGYSSLQAIAELQPDFIKIDRSLISGIHKDKVKEYILETFVTFAHKMNIHLIAEGIEQLDELIKLTRMGIHYAQGYLLGKPSKTCTSISPELENHITKHQRASASDSMLSIGDIAAPVRILQENDPISVVADYFKTHADAPGAVVVSSGKPIGLIMRDQLFQQLSGQYGFSLFWKRPVTQIMNNAPLIVDTQTPVEQVSQLAVSRSAGNLYDLVIITDAGVVASAVSVRSILECMTQERMEKARVANPLTGLPGNQQIQRELQKRLMEKRNFSVIYADLDYFKWFNDAFGFQKGDQLIQYTADIIQYAIAICGSPYDFVGHVGGDDFIAMTATEMPERLCEEIIRRFEQSIHLFYDGEQVTQVEDRNGNFVQNEGVTLSLSLVICSCEIPISSEQISMTAALLKKKCKARKGSIYISQQIGNTTSSELG
jgi:diguanylate cyclase (GGDEF)-like protein